MNREMIDVNAVILGLRTASENLARYAPMKVNGRCQMYFDGAILLLKAQEPIKPTVSVDTWICSKCGHTLESQELIDDKENPQVLIHEQPDDLPPHNYMPICLAMLEKSDAICLLPGWQESKGAMLEKLYAEYQGKRVVDLAEEYGFHPEV